MSGEIELGPDEQVPGRPFTDPAHTRREEEALRMLLAHERQRARAWCDEPSESRRNVVIRETDSAGLRHLLVVPETHALIDAQDLLVVGFFGRPREDAQTALLFDLEERLVAGMSAYAAHGLLSYYDLELVKGAYGNLILFAKPDGPARWGENPVHREAVEISPRNYHEIRLHQGRLPGGILEDGELRLTRTRYIDYSGPEAWRAVRTFPQPL
ncbi:MAG: hypothetical protein ACRDMY_01940 [Gaiellaceae bacterium]